MTTSSGNEPTAERDPSDPPPRLRAVAAEPHLERLRQVYQKSRGRLWRAILAWSGSAEVADEAISEAFTQAARRGPEVKDPEAWVWRAAFRIAAGYLARRRSDHDRTTELIGFDIPVPESASVLPGDAVDLLRALQQLPEQQRQAVVLTDGAGFTAPEAAQVLGTTAATVRVQASRARRRLRPLLSDTATEDPR